MKLKKLTLILTTLLLAVSFMTAQETKGKPTIVVIPFDAKNIEQNDANVLFEVFTNEIAGTGKFKVVDRSKIDKIKKEHEFQNSDWSNNEKVAKLGNVLNANAVITGQLMLFKKDIVATFRMLDVNTMEIVSSATTRVKDTSEFFDKIPEIAKTLMGEIKSISTTSNITTSKPESSSVSTNVSTPKTKSSSVSTNISTPKTRSTSSTSKTTTTYGKTYNIGDTGPRGGIIFYHSESGFDVYEPDGSVKKCHYLEVSKFDLGKISWCSRKVGTNCCNITTLTSVGAGRINTFKIIKSYHSGGTVTKENCAALACHSYSTATTKAGDWFLPSKDELNLLYQNLRKRVLLSNTTNDNFYWSSSQGIGNHAWIQSFSYGYQYDDDFDKYLARSVRAVRAF